MSQYQILTPKQVCDLEGLLLGLNIAALDVMLRDREIVHGCVLVPFALKFSLTLDVSDHVTFTMPSQIGEIQIRTSFFAINNALSGMAFLKSYRYSRFVYSESIVENAITFLFQSIGGVSPVEMRSPQWECGQVKIFSHAMEILSLWIENNREKTSLKILVVGSGGTDSLTSGRTYPLLRYLLKIPCIVDCYDPREEKTETITYIHRERFVINYYKEMYDYATVRDYDIVFDDTWIEGSTNPDFYCDVFKKMDGVVCVSVKGPTELLSRGQAWGFKVFSQYGHINEKRLVRPFLQKNVSYAYHLGLCGCSLCVLTVSSAMRLNIPLSLVLDTLAAVNGRLCSPYKTATRLMLMETATTVVKRCISTDRFFEYMRRHYPSDVTEMQVMEKTERYLENQGRVRIFAPVKVPKVLCLEIDGKDCSVVYNKDCSVKPFIVTDGPMVEVVDDWCVVSPGQLLGVYDSSGKPVVGKTSSPYYKVTLHSMDIRDRPIKRDDMERALAIVCQHVGLRLRVNSRLNFFFLKAMSLYQRSLYEEYGRREKSYTPYYLPTRVRYVQVCIAKRKVKKKPGYSEKIVIGAQWKPGEVSLIRAAKNE